jgi:hypothetical protein
MRGLQDLRVLEVRLIPTMTDPIRIPERPLMIAEYHDHPSPRPSITETTDA